MAQLQFQLAVAYATGASSCVDVVSFSVAHPPAHETDDKPRIRQTYLSLTLHPEHHPELSLHNVAAPKAVRLKSRPLCVFLDLILSKLSLELPDRLSVCSDPLWTLS